MTMPKPFEAVLDDKLNWLSPGSAPWRKEETKQAILKAVAAETKIIIGEDEDLNAPAETYGTNDQSLGDNPYPDPNLQYVVRRATRNVYRDEQRLNAKERGLL